MIRSFLITILAALTISCSITNFHADDQSLSERVQRQLYSNSDPIIANLHAESVNNTIILTGFVKKIKQSDDAQLIASQVRGVREVDNKIIVRQ